MSQGEFPCECCQSVFSCRPPQILMFCHYLGEKKGGGVKGRRGEREKKRDERTFQRSNPHAELQDKVHQVFSDLGQLILCLQQFS